MTEDTGPALRLGIEALNTWLATYADDLVAVEDLEAARQRIKASGGTIGYISCVAETMRKALRDSGIAQETHP